MSKYIISLFSILLLSFTIYTNIRTIQTPHIDSPAKVYERGKAQSPINLEIALSADLDDIKFHYNSHQFDIINTGHATQLSPSKSDKSKENYIIIDGEKYDLVQFHFHSPSEHLIQNKFYPMEVHFVHINKDGNLAVVGILVNKGALNKEFKKIISKIPTEKNKKVELTEEIYIQELMPKDKRDYRYIGSLTTEPYTEGVKWHVIKEPIEFSEEQINAIKKIMNKPNARPVQELNKRKVVFDSTINKPN